MQSFGTIILWALAACTLWNGSLATSLRPGLMFPFNDTSPDSICVPELRSLLNDVVQAQNQGNTNTRESDNEIKSKLETLEVKIGEVQAKLLQEVHAKLEGQLQGVENKLERQLQEGQTKLEAKLGESLLAVQGKIENQLQAVLNQLELVQNKIDVPKVVVPALSTISIPPGFELIGNRYFRIVNEFVDWETAERRCREMGGYLASFRNEDEINAITPKLLVWLYWLGINDRDNEGHFVSVASYKPAPFLKWAAGEPSDRNHKENCAYLAEGIMGDYDCNESNEAYFICQADNET
nr:mannose-binding protein-like [Drosophila kikkawai]